MEPMRQMGTAKLERLLAELRKEYEDFQSQKLTLDMSRGKPNSDQLDLAAGMLDTLSSARGAFSDSGIDWPELWFSHRHSGSEKNDGRDAGRGRG